MVTVYAFLFGIGRVVFSATGSGLALLAVGVPALAWIGRNLAREQGPPLPAPPEPAEREVPALAAG